MLFLHQILCLFHHHHLLLFSWPTYQCCLHLHLFNQLLYQTCHLLVSQPMYQSHPHLRLLIQLYIISLSSSSQPITITSSGIVPDSSSPPLQDCHPTTVASLPDFETCHLSSFKWGHHNGTDFCQLLANRLVKWKSGAFNEILFECQPIQRRLINQEYGERNNGRIAKAFDKVVSLGNIKAAIAEHDNGKPLQLTQQQPDGRTTN